LRIAVNQENGCGGGVQKLGRLAHCGAVGFSPEIPPEAIAESGARAKTAVQEKQSSRRFPVFHRKLT